MSTPPDLPTGSSASLLERLRTLRSQNAGLAAGELHARLMEGLQEELARTGPADASSLLAEARDTLTREARERAATTENLRAEAAKLSAERDALVSEKHTLTSELSGVRAQLEEARRERERLLADAESAAGVRAELAAEKARAEELSRALHEAREGLAAAAAPPPFQAAPLARPDDAGSMDTLRSALRTVATSEDVSQDDDDLPGGDSRLIRLAQELLRFALDYERGIQAFLMGLAIEHQLDTLQIQRQSAAVRKRFLDCLDEEDGSLQRLRETLNSNRRFILDLNESYTRAIPLGVREILGELEPENILAAARGAFGMKDHAEAWRSITDKHAHLRDTPADELLARFFVPAIQNELGSRRGTS